MTDRQVQPLPLTAEQIERIRRTTEAIRERERLEREIAQKSVDLLFRVTGYAMFQMRNQWLLK